MVEKSLKTGNLSVFKAKTGTFKTILLLTLIIQVYS